ncbi:hypothetical protein CW304_23705 [Bacillus sp. UFRGS-B20]|nr:hypothetical protein CW304_23705 [Bacillus sp. UFRGS-B20]
MSFYVTSADQVMETTTSQTSSCFRQPRKEVFIIGADLRKPDDTNLLPFIVQMDTNLLSDKQNLSMHSKKNRLENVYLMAQVNPAKQETLGSRAVDEALLEAYKCLYYINRTAPVLRLQMHNYLRINVMERTRCTK